MDSMEKRRQAIVDFVNQLGEVGITQLKDMFPGVSEVTLRKDLRHLDEAKKLVRIHGGAKSIQDIAGYGNNFSMREMLHHEEKVEIAKKAAALIPEGASVYISSGTSCLEFARHLPQKHLYVFTDGMMVALNIPTHPDIHVEVLGGVFNHNLMRLGGPGVIAALEGLRFDFAVLGTPGFHPQFGFPCTNAMVAATSAKAMEQAEKTVILMDSSKVNYVHTARNIPISNVDILVSDENLPVEIARGLREQGVTVL